MSSTILRASLTVGIALSSITGSTIAVDSNPLAQNPAEKQDSVAKSAVRQTQEIDILHSELLELDEKISLVAENVSTALAIAGKMYSQAFAITGQNIGAIAERAEQAGKIAQDAEKELQSYVEQGSYKMNRIKELLDQRLINKERIKPIITTKILMEGKLADILGTIKTIEIYVVNTKLTAAQITEIEEG